MLSRFLKHSNSSSFNITALVRSSEKAKKLEAFGVTPVVGSHADVALVEKLSSKADVVIATVGFFIIYPIVDKYSWFLNYSKSLFFIIKKG